VDFVSQPVCCHGFTLLCAFLVCVLLLVIGLVFSTSAADSLYLFLALCMLSLDEFCHSVVTVT